MNTKTSFKKNKSFQAKLTTEAILHEIAHAIVDKAVVHRAKWQENTKERKVTWHEIYCK